MFDNISDRVFFLELKEIDPNKKLKNPVVVLSIGEPPQQMAVEEDFSNIFKGDFDEDFYGDEEYDMDELDEEGFGIDGEAYDDDLRYWKRIGDYLISDIG